MAWQDRIRQGAYTSPEKEKRILFTFQDVSRKTEKRTSAFSFAGVNENYVQDNGFGSRQYSLRCFFTGAECDREATAFEAALLETGPGRLEHPFYGTFDVVPFGTIDRRDDLRRAANQAVVEVTFWTTTGVVYPTSESSPRNEVLDAIADFDVEMAQSYEDTIENEKPDERFNLRATVDEFLGGANKALSFIAEGGSVVDPESKKPGLNDILREFRGWQQTINTGINTLVGTPVLLAQQVGNMIKAPASAAVGIENRITGYANFLRSIYGSPAGRPQDQTCACSSPSRQIELSNNFRTADLNALYALVAMALAAVETEFRTKPEALSVADFLLAELEAINAWRDAGYQTFTEPKYGARIEVLDDGRAYRQAHATITLCAGYLVQISFSLATERRIILTRPRTIIDLAAELYGSVDDRLDFIIESNDLSGSEILELPRGREIVWYP